MWFPALPSFSMWPRATPQRDPEQELAPWEEATSRAPCTAPGLSSASLGVPDIAGRLLAHVTGWTGKRFKPNFLVGRGLKISIQAALNRCQIRMFARNPLPDIYSYISSYQKPKQTKHKASNNRKQSRVYSHSPVRWYGWANLKHPCCQKGMILLFFLSSLLPSWSSPSLLLLVTARAHLTGLWETQFTNPVKNWSIKTQFSARVVSSIGSACGQTKAEPAQERG